MLILAARLVGLSMFSTWAWYCFSREFQTTALCEDFHLFPHPQIFEAAWLFLCATSSFLLIFYVRRQLSSFPGFLVVLYHLFRKKYFWKVVVTLISVCIYDILVIWHKPKALKTISYVLFIVEKSLVVAVVLFLNFLPSVKSDLSRQNKSSLKLVIYKAALFLYALEGYTMAILGSTIAVYKVVTVQSGPGPALIHRTSPNVQENLTLSSTQQLQGTNNGYSTVVPPDMETVVGLMLLMTNNALRYYIADFFFSKLFDPDVDTLGGGTKTIPESLAIKRADVDDIATADAAQEIQQASDHVTNPV